MYLTVSTAGGKSFIFRYRDFSGKEQTFTIGRYPAISLAEARSKRNELVSMLAKMALTSISPPDILATLKNCEAGGKLDTLKKVRSILSQVLRHAVGMGKLASDPCRDIPSDVFKQPPKRNLAHQTDPIMITVSPVSHS